MILGSPYGSRVSMVVVMVDMRSNKDLVPLPTAPSSRPSTTISRSLKIQRIPSFESSQSEQDFSNGIGTSHANEIPHLAREHPAQMASVVFNDPARRKMLLDNIILFFAFANDDHYTKWPRHFRGMQPIKAH